MDTNSPKTILEYVEEIHNTAKDKGWWETPRTPLEIAALVHSEVSEAVEAIRVGDKQHEMEEYVDVVIRVFDYFGTHPEYSFEELLNRKMEKNKTRPYKHNKLL